MLLFKRKPKASILETDPDARTIKGKVAKTSMQIVEISRMAIDLLMDRIADGKNIIAEAKTRSKNIAEINMNLARKHYENGDMFDAKLRYRIVLMADKKNVDAMLGLGYVFYMEKSYNKAEKFFRKAMDTDASLVPDLEELIANMRNNTQPTENTDDDEDNMAA